MPTLTRLDGRMLAVHAADLLNLGRRPVVNVPAIGTKCDATGALFDVCVCNDVLLHALVAGVRAVHGKLVAVAVGVVRSQCTFAFDILLRIRGGAVEAPHCLAVLAHCPV